MNVALNPAAQKAMTEVELLPGEMIEHVFQGDGYFLGAHPIAICRSPSPARPSSSYR